MNILIVDDDNASRESISQFLKELGHDVTECPDGVSALKKFLPNYYDIIFSDIKMPLMSGIELVKKIRTLPGGNDVNIILFTGFSETQSAIEALKFGVYDYLLKPINVEEVVSSIERISQFKILKKKNELLSVKRENAHQEPALTAAGTPEASAVIPPVIVENSDAAAEADRKASPKHSPVFKYSIGMNKIGVFCGEMKKIFNYAKMLHEDRSIPVLIEGETGSGKEMVAQFIHYGETGGSELPFVDLNCACISPSLFESELFGYAPGAFTGGLDKGQPGKLDIANNGTIFLDEIADMPLEMQAKLLRVIQEKEYYRVGGLKKIKTNLRIICATNMRLEDRVLEAKFRQDLYYRLNDGRIYIPSLRERHDEIIPLAMLFLKDISEKKGKKFKFISGDAEKLLLNYRWPGNIRQLKNVIERAVFMYDAATLTPEHLDVLIKSDPGTAAYAAAERKTDLKKAGFTTDSPSCLLDFSLPATGVFPLNDHINSIIKKALALNGYNKTRTAKYLGITRRTLYSYLKNIPGL